MSASLPRPAPRVRKRSPSTIRIRISVKKPSDVGIYKSRIKCLMAGLIESLRPQLQPRYFWNLRHVYARADAGTRRTNWRNLIDNQGIHVKGHPVPQARHAIGK